MPEQAGQTTRRLRSWLELLRRGDPAARGELIKHSYQRLRRLAHFMVGDFPAVRRLEETDDVLQSALIRLGRALEDVTPASVPDFFNLAAAQIRRELIDLYRRYYGPQGQAACQVPGREPRSAQDSTPSQDPADTGFGPVSWAQRRELQGMVHECVEKLPEEQREVVNLLFYLGLTQEEAATTAKVSVPTIKRRWRSAKIRLHRLLLERGIGN